MWQRVRVLIPTLLIAVSLVAIVPAPAGAAANEVLANWQMNEGRNADVMFDSSGNGIHGDIGSAVDTGQTFGGGVVAYQWDYVSPTAPPAKPERLVVIDDDRLNPQSDDYAITMRFRTTHPFGNMIQKGQSGQVGGMWKWQMPSGQLVCLFRGVGPQGQQYEEVVNSGANLPRLDDGQWHTARCERRQDQLILTIDEGTPNERVRRANGPTGNISNPIPVTIAGKLNCNQQSITCDYFTGEIDYVIIETSSRNDSPSANASGNCDFLDCDFFSNGSFDPDGTIVNYHWDFGDGNETDGFAPEHTYSEPGTYEATLTVTDDEGATDTDTVTVVATSEPPTAVASADCSFRVCSFTASGSSDPDGSIVSYAWDFGDGNDGTGFSPNHTYSVVGAYTATLTVTDNHGVTDTDTVGIVATNEGPTAAFTVDCDYLSCVFDASAANDPDGTVVTYGWDFGDGDTTSSSDPVVAHEYAAPGTYEVDLTVTDNDAATDDAAASVDVSAAQAVHLHNLAPKPFDKQGSKWVAKVLVAVREANGNKPEGVEVTVTIGAVERSCVTNEAGRCRVRRPVPDTKPKLKLTVIDVQWQAGYDPSANKDRDGNGDGETVRIDRPF
ncbi:MAG: PKD domain-containing protein [Acidimicrobiia bacterium]|nr:PKD domain-containing protein [Acidimicrobiia bacterium]